jgi:hypothetical protein
MTSFVSNACALLIGIDDYSDFDTTGARDLRGSVNDVRVWWKICMALGMSPGNVWVLTSPPLAATASLQPHGATRRRFLQGHGATPLQHDGATRAGGMA